MWGGEKNTPEVGHHTVVWQKTHTTFKTIRPVITKIQSLPFAAFCPNS